MGVHRGWDSSTILNTATKVTHDVIRDIEMWSNEMEVPFSPLRHERFEEQFDDKAKEYVAKLTTEKQKYA